MSIIFRALGASALVLLTAAPVTAATPGPGSPVGGPKLSGVELVTDLPADVPPPPPIAAGAYLLADLDTGAVLVAKAPHLQSKPASTLKTLTALTLVPTLPPTKVVRATPEDAAIDGTKVGLDPGAGYTVEQLFQGLLMSSGNDAAQALARAGGGMPRVAQSMTQVAHDLGALDTQARNTSGLDAPGQLTSSYDLALIGRAALRDPQIANYVSTRSVTFPGKRVRGPNPGKRPTFEIGNHNRLLFNYEGAIGVKNGYTQAARHTYIGAARRANQGYILTFLGGQSADWHQSAAMFDWAFAYGKKAHQIGKLVEPGDLAQETPAPTPSRREPAADTAVAAIRNNAAAATMRDPRWTVAGVGGLITAAALYIAVRRSKKPVRGRRG
ncbi:D-alanyl-D-alanine carboxypeptidase family protein [Gephyromycinifex aptenodytis]|uniref:D-alanyl-D-alanine carboxypeptidase family protein n=1 Tax=Gephyromycinifex aptenodytis TaxID=2716227 RepID=UPI00144518C5|nr:D-alanyl-D-alanine carboxypeptidase [Gephyromycinifex aptenodytis]